jgi:hypothetical protein
VDSNTSKLESRKPIKHRFNLLLCDHTRRELTKRHTTRSTLTPRVPLASYFHARYIDNRPLHLRQIRVFDTHPRPWRTVVLLTPQQVTQILKLIELLDINPSPTAKIIPSSRGLMTYLLSTFLAAVMHGYLVEDTRILNSDAFEDTDSS